MRSRPGATNTYTARTDRNIGGLYPREFTIYAMSVEGKAEESAHPSGENAPSAGSHFCRLLQNVPFLLANDTAAFPQTSDLLPELIRAASDEDFARGGVYEGEREEGLPHGRGRILYYDGGSYDGEWYRGHRHGDGICWFADGTVYDGAWRHDAFHGWGLFIDAMGQAYEAEWVHGQPATPSLVILEECTVH